jgi:AraC-like DNA-binding protein
VLYLVVVVLLNFVNAYQFEMDYLLLVIMSISMYTIGYSAINNPEIFKATAELKEEIAIRNPLNPGKFPGLKEKLLQYMEADKPYLKSDLKISELADALGVPAYQLSQTINDGFLVNFYDFINKYRIEEAKKLLIGDTRNYKILAIAYEVGFNSKATFNRVFKSSTGLTPSDFRERFASQGGELSAEV